MTATTTLGMMKKSPKYWLSVSRTHGIFANDSALLSAIGAKKNAKRAAMVHLYFNIIGTVVFMVLFYAINAVVQFPFMNQAANAAGIAVAFTTTSSTASLIVFASV